MASDRILAAIHQVAFREVETLKAAGVDVRAINVTAFVSVSAGVVSVSTTPPDREPELDFSRDVLIARKAAQEDELIPVNEPEEPAPAKSIRRKPAKK